METLGSKTDGWVPRISALVAMSLSLLCGEESSELPEFIDYRDEKAYPVVKIGKQIWMAQNLDYAMEGGYCYDNNPDNCAKYGRLYTLYAAVEACPTGWHLPTSKEWDELETTLGENAGTKLKSKDWGGTDAAGFHAIPAGFQAFGVQSLFLGNSAYFWTVREVNFRGKRSAHPEYRRLDRDSLLYHGHQGPSPLVNADPMNAYSVRCLKDSQRSHIEEKPMRCESEQTIALAKSIIAEQLLKGNSFCSASGCKELQNENDVEDVRNHLKFQYPRATSYDDQIKKYSCTAEVFLDGKELVDGEFVYESQLTYKGARIDDNIVIVFISSVDEETVFSFLQSLPKKRKAARKQK